MSDLGNKAVMAKNIQHYMDLSGKSRQDICKALGFKYTTFTDWIKGNTYPRIDKIELMANYFGIEKSDLVENHPYRDARLSLTSSEERLLILYNRLNPIGQEEATKRVEELGEISKYIDHPVEIHSLSYSQY